MKVLWSILIEFPPLAIKLNHSIPSSCGWLYASAKAILKLMPELKLGVAVYSYGDDYEEYDIDGISYYLIPSKNMTKPDKKQVESCRRTISEFKPDLIHVHGTEHSLAQAMVVANEGRIRTLANIQGLATGIAPMADGGLSFWDKLFNVTPLDFYRGTFLLTTKYCMTKRARCEEYVIKNVTDIAGRTQWDKDHVLTINPLINYHHLNETLRDSFYDGDRWSQKKCKPHTIFLSNSSSPLKGAHNFLKALEIVIKVYPDTQVVVCGSSVLNNDFRTCIKFQGYHLFLRRLVKRKNLQSHITFTGALNEYQMKQAFLEANVYVLSSSIENSSNSLCEAQILGVPTVASYCGGTPSLIEDGKTGYLYRYEEHVQLAQRIINLFASDDLSELSRCEQEVANARHDREANAKELARIYNRILNR